MTMKQAKPVTKKQILFYVFTLLFASLVLSGCSQEKAESASLIICKDYFDLINEADTGVITDSELRERYKLIYEKAKTLNDSEILSGVTKTLAAVTRGNDSEYLDEIEDFTGLCIDRLGLEIAKELVGI